MSREPRLAESFLRSFALPLVAGGDVHVGRPLDSRAVDHLIASAATLEHATCALERARQRAAHALWPATVNTPLDADSLRLLAGVHNLLFLSHPAFEPRRTGVAATRLHAFTRRCLQIGTPADEQQLVARHTLVGRIHGLRRTDIDVRFWLGRRKFLGQEPPSRLLRWPKTRRLRVDRRQVHWLDEVSIPRQQSLVRALFAASPLTELLALPRQFPPIQWERLTPHLRGPRVARAVCHAYLALGLNEVGPQIARSFWGLVDRLRLDKWPNRQCTRTSAQRALRLVVGLVEYLYASLSLTGPLTLPVTAPEAVADSQSPGEPAWRRTLEGVLVAGRRCALSQMGRPADPLGDGDGAGGGGAVRVHHCVDQLVAAAEQRMDQQAEQLVASLEQALEPAH